VTAHRREWRLTERRDWHLTERRDWLPLTSTLYARRRVASLRIVTEIFDAA
jgi:hypothetical protein